MNDDAMERFVQFVVAGGLVLVAGLWITALTNTGSLPWLAGATAAAAGALSVLWGIWTQVER